MPKYDIGRDLGNILGTGLIRKDEVLLTAQVTFLSHNYHHHMHVVCIMQACSRGDVEGGDGRRIPQTCE